MVCEHIAGGYVGFGSIVDSDSYYIPGTRVCPLRIESC